MQKDLYICKCVCRNTYICTHVIICIYMNKKRQDCYGVASVSRINKITGLFCKRALQKRRYSAKETCNFIDPTNRSHPIMEYSQKQCDAVKL